MIISINQRSKLIDTIKKYLPRFYSAHHDNMDDERIWEATKDMPEQTYRKLYALAYNQLEEDFIKEFLPLIK